MKTFSDRLESHRKGLSQKAFAKSLGLPLNTYTNWVRGVNCPKADQLKNICIKLGVSADWLLGLDNAPQAKAVNVSDAERKLDGLKKAITALLQEY